jgi:hypothetical protein
MYSHMHNWNNWDAKFCGKSDVEHRKENFSMAICDPLFVSSHHSDF